MASNTKIELTSGTKILFIYPHPDDETFANAGLIQRMIQHKSHPYVMCLTKGGASTLTFSLNESDVLTTVREQEFVTIMNFLSVNTYKILDLTDGNLESEFNLVYEAIKYYIEEIKPDYIATYEPGGIYGHKDHIIVTSIVSKLCNVNNIKLIYSTVPTHYKQSKSALSMAADASKVKPLAPNYTLRLTWKEYFKKLTALGMYKSQMSLKHEFWHKIYQIFNLFDEYYYVPES